MTEPTIHGHTKSGRPITDQDIESLAAEAEAGYDVRDADRPPRQARPAHARERPGQRGVSPAGP